jgi:hypothetical protein
VTLYAGEVVTERELKERPPSFYVYKVSGDVFIDGANGWEGTHGLGRFINSCPKDGKNNCNFVNHPLGFHVSVKTTKPVKKGEEFFVSYGKLTPPPSYRWLTISFQEACIARKKVWSRRVSTRRDALAGLLDRRSLVEYSPHRFRA